MHANIILEDKMNTLFPSMMCIYFQFSNALQIVKQSDQIERQIAAPAFQAMIFSSGVLSIKSIVTKHTYDP